MNHEESLLEILEDGSDLVCDSVIIKDQAVMNRLWELSSDTLSFETIEGRMGRIRLCALFYDRDGDLERTVSLSYEPEMEINGCLYGRNVPLFNALIDFLPSDYLQMPQMHEKDTTSFGNYYYDPEICWFKNAEGKIYDPMGMIKYGWELSGDTTDMRIYVPVPALVVTGNPADTGYYYEEAMRGNYRDQMGNFIDPDSLKKR